MKFLPFALPSIGEEEIEAVAGAMRSGWLTTGPKTAEFEAEFAGAVGARHALAVNSATAGLHLSLDAAGVRRDDIVIVPVWTFTATAEVVNYLGARPLFVDMDRQTFNISPSAIESAIEALTAAERQRLRAIIPVHYAGQACDMKAILEVAARHGLAVVEDAAHAFPTTVRSPSVSDPSLKERMVGTVGHLTAFSFYATKTITTGEGGMVTTNDDELAARVRLMRLHGISRDVWNRYVSDKPSWYYEVVEAGYKYNLTDIASAIGLQQLKRAEAFRKRRHWIADCYNQAFSDNPCLEIPAPKDPGAVHAWHLYPLRLRLERLSLNRDLFIARMAESGVGCSVHFIPLHLHPYWRERYALEPEQFPVASAEFPREVSLPIYPAMTDEDVRHVMASVAAICKDFEKG